MHAFCGQSPIPAWLRGNMKRILCVASFLFTTVSAFSRVSTTDYYVAKNGNDTNPGTLAQPWKTIQRAADTVQAGDTVNVRQGIYRERVAVHVSGSSGT